MKLHKLSSFTSQTVLALLIYTPAQAATVTQQALSDLASQLQITYEVQDNLNVKDCDQSIAEGQCFLATLSLTLPQDQVLQNWSLYFSHTRPIQWDGSDLFDIEHVNGDLHRLTPTSAFAGFKANQRYSIPLKAAHAFVSESDIMPNYYVVAPDLQPRIVISTQERPSAESPLVSVPHALPFDRIEQQKRHITDNSPYATSDWLYSYYQGLNGPKESTKGTVRTIPSLSNKALSGQWLPLPKGISLRMPSPGLKTWLQAAGLDITDNGLAIIAETDNSLAAESYRLEIDQNIRLFAADDAGYFYGLVSLVGLYQSEKGLPKGTYSDGPRYGFRGLHLDVARNFQPKSQVLSLLDAMALLKLNKLHLHLADDEGWRLQIPGLAELTEVGAYRCHDLTERRCLLPQLGSGPFADSPVNGYYSVDDYQEIVRYAKDRHIEVIPSLDMPGHSRAAIKAMEARYQRYSKLEKPAQAEEFLLSEFADTTRYSSVQFYHDNTLNPCLDSTYRFINKVLSEVKAMHESAGVSLGRYHIGADETAGAWKGSPACQTLMASNGIDKTEDLVGYFIQKVAAMVNDMGIEAAAWSDGLSHVSKDSLAPKIQANIWDTLFWQGHNRAHQFANEGWETVLSLPDVLYFDFPYLNHAKEPGYYWGSRSTDSFQVFQFMPDNLPAHAELWTDRMGNAYTAKDDIPLAEQSRYAGIQAQLWSETVRSPAQADYMLFPRLLAFAERAWHHSDWELPYVAGREYGPQTQYFGEMRRQAQLADWQGFSEALSKRYLPLLIKAGRLVRLPPPGAIRQGGKILANQPWPHLIIEYQLPGQDWQLYQGALSSDSEIRFRSRLPQFDLTSPVSLVPAQRTGTKG
ncbi:family 20 glycosylhydrolase [Aliiglaciecola sp. CAU 1673]|uniref:family 20 glycosylhydrolase n=1 Tax=Aliiglaciecola sp. CAU 1673 TaxID=3032595 RepID=UPI0023DC0157|nr:family 20 glycosylhydrolase [Aliiglaciecola sp. CAU 1673]MDF2179870.1 family 20 glycosylhydrolase [Aliiglaciecola sp. CAU 1673]